LGPQRRSPGCCFQAEASRSQHPSRIQDDQQPSVLIHFPSHVLRLWRRSPRRKNGTFHTSIPPPPLNQLFRILTDIHVVGSLEVHLPLAHQHERKRHLKRVRNGEQPRQQPAHPPRPHLQLTHASHQLRSVLQRRFPRPATDPAFYDSLESIHGQIHGMTGRNGHMGVVDFAAFDPVFWMHHANVSGE
jgi:hypothetical protein